MRQRVSGLKTRPKSWPIASNFWVNRNLEKRFSKIQGLNPFPPLNTSVINIIYPNQPTPASQYETNKTIKSTKIFSTCLTSSQKFPYHHIPQNIGYKSSCYNLIIIFIQIINPDDLIIIFKHIINPDDQLYYNLIYICFTHDSERKHKLSCIINFI